jgi:hypothetical protein
MRAVSQIPVPESDTVCGLPAALSATDSLAVRAARTVGRKVTLIVQLAPAARLLPQVLVCAKFDLLVPVMEMLEIVMVAVPVFVSVTVRAALVVLIAWEPNEMDASDSEATGPAPVPDRATACGLPVALSLILSVAVRLPTAVGRNVTLTVQLPPAARELPQVVVREKFDAFVPPTVMLEIVSDAVPVFRRVSVLAGLADPTARVPKESDDGDRLTAGAAAP